MYVVRFFKFYILLFICISSSFGQNCKTSGEWCSDTELCCGGCCIQNACVNMNYDDCTQIEEPCLEEYCPADSVCRLYKPSCMGCDIERRCISINSNDVQFNMDPSIVASAPRLKIMGVEYLLWYFLLIKCLL